MALPLLIPAALGAVKAGAGIADMIKGRKALKSAKDPGVISDAERKAVADAKQRALGGLPTDKLAVEAIQRNKANTMAALTQGGSSKNVMSAMLASQGTAQQGMSQELAQQAQQKLAMTQSAEKMDADLGAKSIADKQKKYQETVTAAKEDIQTGKKNIMAGLTDIGGAAIKGMGGADAGGDTEDAGGGPGLGLNASSLNLSTPKLNKPTKKKSLFGNTSNFWDFN